MGTTKEIEHPGVITSIDSSKIKVNITTYSACSSCNAEGICSISDVKDKMVEVPNTGDFFVGQEVQVILNQTLGFKALYLGYVQPFIVVLITLIITSSLTRNEVLAGLISLGALAPYYLVLYYYKEKIRNKFTFAIKKQEQ
ncbi:MAG: SoxR reducing system RseC family protein [Bacteroidales bacterium]|nr:SoxR reducing system RseC family protein [Bacteroidales bacterium]